MDVKHAFYIDGLFSICMLGVSGFRPVLLIFDLDDAISIFQKINFNMNLYKLTRQNTFGPNRPGSQKPKVWTPQMSSQHLRFEFWCQISAPRPRPDNIASAWEKTCPKMFPRFTGLPKTKVTLIPHFLHSCKMHKVRTFWSKIYRIFLDQTELAPSIPKCILAVLSPSAVLTALC